MSPVDIDILIVNCSGFCPVPSLSSIIVNKYNMRSDIKTFNISGMGCAAGVLGIDMAHNFLRVHKRSNAVVLSTEILSTGWYPGHEREKLLLNCLFRMGSSAVLLTNRIELPRKYKMVYSFRTQKASDDRAYYAAIREEDSNGKLGVTLKKRDILQAASDNLRANLTVLGSRMLPFSEIVKHEISLIWKKYLDKSVDIYVPSFKTVFQHFCLPTSGKLMIQEIAKGLKLGEGDAEAALMTLHRFGNQSSSALWYELAYLEGKERVNKGDRVWLVAVGTGAKCASIVLECVRPVTGESRIGPWDCSIHRYPITASTD